MTDTDTLREQLWDAIFASRDMDDGAEAPTENVVNAVLAVVQPAIREAQAEAWGKGHSAGWHDQAVDHPSAPLTLTTNPYRDERSTDA